MTKVLVLGASGMLGSAVFTHLSRSTGIEVWGSLRSAAGRSYFPADVQGRLLAGIDVLEFDSLARVVAKVRPDWIINCVGLIKQLADANDPLQALPVNALLPHRLARLAELAGARMVHVSTDCVFAGTRGMYLESDFADADDLYGRSKYLGEVHDQPHVITLRTSIIGHELGSANALVDWFLSQQGQVKGYRKAIFSGLPTAELARVIRDFVMPTPGLSGLYHVSAEAIDKYALLTLVADSYGKKIEIIPDEKVAIDRSLDSSRFRGATGYMPASWPQLVGLMQKSRIQR